MIGFRLYHYRKLTIEFLDLKRGDTVVELGCGTGLNFPLLQQRIGDEGKIIGVDITDKMLENAGFVESDLRLEDDDIRAKSPSN